MRRLMTLGFATIFLAAALPLTVLAKDKDPKRDVDKIGERRVARRSLVSQEKEIAIGKQYSTEIDRSAKLLQDPVVNEYVNRLAQNIGRNSDLTIPLTVKVIDSPELNAFALPGGFLYVNSGLILAADEEAQVAGVIAHEIAHVTARHWASQVTKAQIAQYALLPLIFIPMSYPVYYGVIEAYMNGVPLAFLKFSRGAEAEADMLGLQYMFKAGYDPNAYITFFSKIIEQDRRSPGTIPTIFASHPPTPERILASEQDIKTMLPEREQYLVSTSEFEDVKSRLQIVINNRKKSDRQDGPTLRKREMEERTDSDPSAGQPSEGADDDQPPVLKRRD